MSIHQDPRIFSLIHRILIATAHPWPLHKNSLRKQGENQQALAR
jgi:hypothetical protein